MKKIHPINTKICKKAVLLVLSMALSSVIWAGDETWNLDITTATAKAKAENKILLLEFHGSDWCPPCIKLNNNILSKDAFKAYASKNLILVNLDFPRQTELSAEQSAHNSELARKYGIEGFPTIILIHPDGKVIDSLVGYPDGGYDGFMKFLNKNIKS